VTREETDKLERSLGRLEGQQEVLLSSAKRVEEDLDALRRQFAAHQLQTTERNKEYCERIRQVEKVVSGLAPRFFAQEVRDREQDAVDEAKQKREKEERVRRQWLIGLVFAFAVSTMVFVADFAAQVYFETLRERESEEAG
jgi:hypothetical protein